MPEPRQKRATASATRGKIVNRLDAHDRRLRKLEGDGRWLRETLSRISESIVGIGERMTVMGQRFGLVEADLRSISRALSTTTETE